MKLRTVFALLALAACTETGTIGYVADPDAATPADAAPEVRDADATVDVALIDECKPGVSSAVPVATVQALRAGGELDPSVRWLYPYHETVFPRGVGAPSLMWDGIETEALYVRIRARSFAYDGCVFPASPGSLQLSEAVWQRAELATDGADDPLLVTLTMLSNGRVVTLPTRSLMIAPGTLRGSVHYMTYGSRTVPTSSGAAVVRLELGASAEPEVAPIACAGCHGVASRGSRLLAYSTGLSVGYRLSSSDPASPVALPVTPPVAELAALTPDGAWYVAPARPTGLGPRFYGGGGLLDAATYNTDTGMMRVNGGVAAGAMMPAFSPEGDALAFTDVALDRGRGLAVMRFDAPNALASEYREVFRDPTRYPGWPTFLPAQRGLVFALGERSDYSGNGARILITTVSGPRSDVFALALGAEADAHMLHRAMGFASAEDADNERSYLPFGKEELHQSYNPNTAAVQVGGYYWVFFDSVRHYGSLGLHRAIWCAAIDANLDRPFDAAASHPAFYVRGQDVDANSIRPVFALDAP